MSLAIYNFIILMGWLLLVVGLFMVGGISPKDELPKILQKAVLAIGLEIFGAAALLAGILYHLW